LQLVIVKIMAGTRLASIRGDAGLLRDYGRKRLSDVYGDHRGAKV